MVTAPSALLVAATALAWLARASSSSSPSASASLSSSSSSSSASSSSSSSPSLSWSRAAGPVIRCEPCDAGARTLCKPVPLDCAERVREPGCGCCLTCALLAGARCGVYTGRCGAGLACRHESGEPRPLLALLEGRGVCVNGTKARAKGAGGARATGTNQEVHGARIPEGDPSSNTMSVPVPTEHEQSTHIFDPHEQQPPPYPPPHHPKIELIHREEARRGQSFKKEEPPAVVPSDKQNFSFDSRQEPEYGPCRREMESILNGLKIADMLNPRGFRIPNCDKKGFYKKRQCRPSKGRKRGLCWCVDKYGQSLPGFEGQERGNAQCYAMDNQ
ncbi:insulin-like growth factor-binding protein 3 [Salminus brasiliensis]|uniref:insulin-like growth factor-binding protein 3 n=1 Tax=Salminus brasiliensis TaxID=930266 RepID=UPI003B8358B9